MDVYRINRTRGHAVRVLTDHSSDKQVLVEGHATEGHCRRVLLFGSDEDRGCTRRWEYSHLVRAVLAIVALVGLTGAIAI